MKSTATHTPGAPRQRFAEPLRSQVIRALTNAGTRTATADVAMKKWEAGAHPEPCIEEVAGKPYGLATDCRCVGCVERLCFQMFQQVQVNLGG